MTADEKEKKEENKEEEQEITIEATGEDMGGEKSLPEERLKKLEEKLRKCQELKEEYLGGWQRAKADLINARKDDERKNQEFLKFSNAALVFEILPVLDSFEMAFANEKEDSKNSKGFYMIKMQLEDILKRYGLEPIKSVGEKLDLRLHEAVGEVESEKEEGLIMEEMQRGYTLHGKILRPARVKVSAKSGSARG